jgi:hypothetical protein
MKSDPKSPHPPELDFQEYLDGEMDSEASHSFENHLAACKDCTVELAYWQKTFGQIESLPDFSLNKDLSKVVITQVSKSSENVRLLYLILAEAALGTTLAMVFWPRMSLWLAETISNLRMTAANSLSQIQIGFSNFLDPLESITANLFSLRSETLLGTTYIIPTAAVIVLLLILGNGIVLKSTQPDQQRRR